MEKQIRNNRMIMVCLLLISLVSSWLLVNFLVGQVGGSADTEALNHIVENTEQLHYSFYSRIEDTWTIMDIGGQSISKLGAAPDSDVLSAINLLREKAGASSIYLITREGQYLDSSGGTGLWQLDASMLPLLRGEERLCRLRQEETGGDLLDFALLLDAPVTQQEYCLLLMEYKLDTFLKVLALKTYGGNGIAYVVDSAGRTLFRTEGTLPADRAQNYFFYQFLKDMTFEGGEGVTDVDTLRAAVNAGRTGAAYVSGGRYSYALSYRPLDIMDWHLMLMVEHSAISGGRMEYMKQVQWVALGVNLLIMLVCLAFYMVNSVWIRKRTAVQLSRRERIINVLSTNSQGVFLLMEQGKGTCTFVSESVEDILGLPVRALLERDITPLLRLFDNEPLERMLRGWDGAAMLESERFLLRAGDGGAD